MYTLRTYPVSGMITWTRRYIYVFIFLAIIPVFLYEVLDWYWLHLPWLPIALVGTAVAFLVGFKNNASYGRLWEARKIWGGIVNTSRSFTIMVNDFITNEHAEKPLSEGEMQAVRKEIVLRHVAWMTCLRHALREHKTWEIAKRNKSDREYIERNLEIREHKYTLEEELEGYLSEEEKAYVLSKTNKQAACINLQSKHLKDLKMKGLIEDFRHMEMENMLVELYTHQGKAERIKNFPYPRQFATLNFLFVWMFVISLPFGVMNEFNDVGKEVIADINAHKPFPDGSFYHVIEFLGNNFIWLSIPFSVVLSWIFHTMERIGEVSENPFEGGPNDVPITTMARGIEIDIRQMIDDDPDKIPEPIEEKMNIQM